VLWACEEYRGLACLVGLVVREEPVPLPEHKPPPLPALRVGAARKGPGAAARERMQRDGRAKGGVGRTLCDPPSLMIQPCSESGYRRGRSGRAGGVHTHVSGRASGVEGAAREGAYRVDERLLGGHGASSHRYAAACPAVSPRGRWGRRRISPCVERSAVRAGAAYRARSVSEGRDRTRRAVRRAGGASTTRDVSSAPRDAARAGCLLSLFPPPSSAAFAAVAGRSRGRVLGGAVRLRAPRKNTAAPCPLVASTPPAGVAACATLSRARTVCWGPVPCAVCACVGRASSVAASSVAAPRPPPRCHRTGG